MTVEANHSKSKRPRRVVLAVVLWITLTQPVLSQIASNSHPTVYSGRAAAARVDALFAPWSKSDTPGAAMSVIKDGKVLLKKGYGLANLESKKPITPDTVFLLASVTKQFTAMAIMMLAERGKLKYEDALTKFFPEFRRHAEKVTVRHLLTHTAGFPEYDDLWVKNGTVDSDWPRSAKTKPSTFEPTSKDVMKLMAQQQLEFTPGEKWEYSNSGYVILAQIVE
jgi:D-alanyl-D-alanine carboxypeptidase